MRDVRCWVCGGSIEPFWSTGELSITRCSACRHLQAEHFRGDRAVDDYHLGYDQGRFVQALSVTRRRQAERILDALTASGSVPSLLDFGCGRGWLLEVAKERGVQRLAGADVSELALDLLRQRGVTALKLPVDASFEHLDWTRLDFVPDTICFLDVLEHFAGDLSVRLSPWLRQLPSDVQRVVIKVPVHDGLLFGIADIGRRLGLAGPAKQLFQAGTFPPHYQYFSRRSLELFVQRLGLEITSVLDDLDFEPEQLADRVGGLSPRLTPLVRRGGRWLGTLASRLRRTDSRIVVAELPRAR